MWGARRCVGAPPGTFGGLPGRWGGAPCLSRTGGSPGISTKPSLHTPRPCCFPSLQGRRAAATTSFSSRTKEMPLPPKASLPGLAALPGASLGCLVLFLTEFQGAWALGRVKELHPSLPRLLHPAGAVPTMGTVPGRGQGPTMGCQAGSGGSQLPPASCPELQAKTPKPGAISPLCHHQLSIISSPRALGHQCLLEKVAPSHSCAPCSSALLFNFRALADL